MSIYIRDADARTTLGFWPREISTPETAIETMAFCQRAFDSFYVFSTISHVPACVFVRVSSAHSVMYVRTGGEVLQQLELHI